MSESTTAPSREERLRDALLGPSWRLSPTQRLWGWLGPLFLTLVGGIVRFWDLGFPHKLVFDETYYVKQAASMLRFGVEMRVRPDLKEPKPNQMFEAGNLDIFSTKDGDLAVHPPFGKWAIGAGEWLFGPTSSVGWRFTVAVLGTLSILLVGRVALRMFRSVGLACIASFLLAFEGLHLTMSRVGLLDMVLSFLVLAGFLALLVDRDQSRLRLARVVGALPEGTSPTGWGPWLGLRPWRWVAGVCLGLAGSTKFSGFVFLAALGLLTVWWDMGARRAAGVRSFLPAALLKDGPLAALVMLGPALAAYTLTWVGWFTTTTGYHRQWDVYNPGKGLQWLPPTLRNWVKYHQDMYTSAASITSEHAYMSNPWGWLVQARPTSMYYESVKKGDLGCDVASCSSAINPIGTVSLWWLGCVALLACVWWWAARRDWRAGALLALVAAGWGPWFLYQERTVFSFYAVAFEPYVVLAVTMLLGHYLTGAVGARARQRRVWVVAGYLLLTLVLFAFFLPVHTGAVVPYPQWQWRMWFPSWV